MSAGVAIFAEGVVGLDIKIGLRTIELLRRISDGRMNDIDFVKYTPQKIRFQEEIKLKQQFDRAEPEEEGIASEYLERFFKELQQMPKTRVHSFMILRNGRVIAEGSFPPYRQEVWHISHSMCKSIVALAVGMAIEEGKLKLTDRVSELLKDWKKQLSVPPKKNITVRDLLIMSSGMIANETAAVTGNEWTRSCLESSQRFEPGTKFHYNSMNTYLLTVILQTVTGKSLMDYLQPRLFSPLGIERVLWEKSPEGVEKGGWGMYLAVEDMAKIGQLCLQNGEWNGKQLVPAAWIQEAGSYHIDSTAGNGCYGYGYQMWGGKCTGSYLFNGMLGQIVYIIPKLSMVLVFTGGSENLYRDNPVNELIERYFDDAFIPTEQESNPKAAERLRSTLRHLRYENASSSRNRYAIGGTISRTPDYEMERQALRLDGRSYSLPANTVGLLPLFIQCVHNNYSQGLSQLRFYREEDGIVMFVTEGEDTNKIPLGFAETKYCEIRENGEVFLAAVDAGMVRNEDDVPVLKIVISLIETANVRIIKLFFEHDRVRAHFLETPGIEMMLNGINGAVAGFGSERISDGAKSVMDSEYVENRLKRAFEPRFDLIPEEV